jgi:hypothetical protein
MQTYLLTEYQILGELFWGESTSELIDFNLALVELVDQLALIADQIVNQSTRNETIKRGENQTYVLNLSLNSKNKG